MSILQRHLLGAVVNVALNFVLIPDFGVIGAAWATVVSYSVAGMFYDLAQRHTRHMFRMKLKAFEFSRILKHGFLRH